MFIMDKYLLDEYCSWLFGILFELRKRIDNGDLDAFQGRFYGRVSEILFNVWIYHKTLSRQILKSQIMEIPYVRIEKINWKKKATAFLKSKFLGRKYESSF